MTQVFVVLVQGNQWNSASVVEPFSWNQRREISKFTGYGAIQRAQYWQQVLDENPWLTKLQIAENEGINRTVVYLHFNLLKLPQEIIDFVLKLERQQDQSYFSERRLRPLIKMCRDEQLQEFEEICSIWRGVQARRRRKKTCKT